MIKYVYQYAYGIKYILYVYIYIYTWNCVDISRHEVLETLRPQEENSLEMPPAVAIMQDGNCVLKFDGVVRI